MPQQTIETAKAVIAEAKKANAAQHAQQELADAESALQNALDQLAKHNDFEARSFATRAKERAEAALQRARTKQPSAPVPPTAPPTVATTEAKSEGQLPQGPASDSSKRRKGKKGKGGPPRQS
jgi:hypothetical protein